MTKIGIIGAEQGHFLQKFLGWLRKRMLKLWNLTRISLLLTFLNSKTGCTLFSHDLKFLISNGASLYGLERVVRNVVGVRSKSARTGRKARLEKLIDERNSDGVLVFKTSSNDYLSWASTEDNVMRLSFYSDSSNTFTFSGKGSGAENISGTFLKSGNIHYLNTELFTKVQSAVLGSLQTKVPLSIMMNGTVIQEYSITE